MRLRLLISLLGLCAPMLAHGFECDSLWGPLARGCARLENTYEKGNNELLVSGYSYHLRSTYTAEKLRELNEKAWGGGWARTTEDSDGDTHSVFGLAFLDSHKNIQWNAGYLYQTYWGNKGALQPGIGYTAMIVQRPDIASGVPIPAVLPVISLKYEQATIAATYIPTLSGVNNGSVIYVFGKYLFK